jgi:cell division septum initiation protein DivIVA
MNPNSSSNRDVIELWGRDFNLVKNGLSEAQVVSFVNDLAKQHDVLLQRQEHLAALTKLAERTVSEADRIADELKQDAKKQAQTEVNKLLAEAEVTAKTQSSRIISDAESAAKAQAQRILSDAELRAEQLIKEKESLAMVAAAEQAEAIKATAEKLANETRREADTEAKKIVSDAETRAKHLVEQKEAEVAAKAEEKANQIIADAQKEAAFLLEREKQRIQPELVQFVRKLRSQLLSEIDDIKSKFGSLESQLGEALSVTLPDSVVSKVSEVSSTEIKNDNTDTFMDLVKDTDRSDDDSKPEWELEIVPPIDIMKIMSIVGYLDNLPDVIRTEIIPRNDRTTVTVYTGQKLELLSLIKALPEVASVEEMLLPGNDKTDPRRLTMALSSKENTVATMVDVDILPDTSK